MPAFSGPAENANDLFVLVFFAGFHAFFHMVDRSINGFDGRHTMSAFVVLGFFQMMLGLLQGFQRRQHVGLIVIVVTCDSRNGNTQKTENNR
jgi:hypothetical protein